MKDLCAVFIDKEPITIQTTTAWTIAFQNLHK